MRKFIQRAISLLMTIAVMSTLIVVPAHATSTKYPNAPDIVDPSVDSKGKVDPGSFMIGETWKKGNKIWVLKEFVDQGSWSNDNITQAIDRAREYGVAAGYSDGTFDRWGDTTMNFADTFIARFFYETGVTGTKIGTATLGGIKSSKTPSSSKTTLTRLEAIKLAGLTGIAQSTGISKSDFSTTLGEFSSPRRAPDGTVTKDIYPRVFLGTEFHTETAYEMGYFTDEDRRVFTGDYARAANFLMYAGVLQGYNGAGLKPELTINRGQMVKLLIALVDMVDYGVDMPEEINVSADLNLSASNEYINYKDWDNGYDPEITVTFNGRGSEGDNFEITGESAILGDLGTIAYDNYGKETLTYTQQDVGMRPGTSAKDYVGQKITDTIYGELVAEMSGEEDYDEDSVRVSITITNEDPNASMSVTSKVDGQKYPDTFFYINNPIEIKDSSSDPEAPLEKIQYAVQLNNQTVAVVTDFEEIDNPNDSWLTLVPDKDTQTISMETTRPGKYTIKVIVTDECGYQDQGSKTIVITGEPQAPTAVISTNGYAFLNRATNVKDASTDPNDDIISWDWADIKVQATTESDDGSEPVTSWETPASGSYTQKNLKDYTGSKKVSSVDGSLTFSQKGLYQIGLTVTDATGLSDTTYKEIKVIENIPVPTPEIGPENPEDPDTPPDDPDDPSGGGNGGYPYYDGDTLVVKQNRLFYIDISNSLNPPDSPIQWDQTEWVVEPTGDYNTSDLRLGKDSTVKKHNYLSKEVGEFTITITLHNKYSDDQVINNPTNPDLSARTTTIKVRVVPDENPDVAIQLQNAQPNFHDNPSSINIKVMATASSPDNDIINYYDWTLSRDNNNDGVYGSDEVIKTYTKTKKSEFDLPVPFESGNTSLFQAQVKVTEKFGQPTISSEIDDDDYLTAEAETTFEVNWIPCIQYSMREFAYTDDVLTITPTLKDENVETCTVDWALWKKSGDNWVEVDPDTLTVWDLDLHGGQIQIPTDGYYKLSARITDAEGHYEDFTSTEIRIYHLPVAVISDGEDYRWDGQMFNFKEARKFTLDGNASYADDSTGPALHPIDHNKDFWKIIPLDGQDPTSIYVMNDNGTGRLASHDSTVFYAGDNAFDEELAILDPGRYLIQYQVTNTYGKKSPMVEQIITIQEDQPPVITGNVEPVVERGPEKDGSDVILSIGNLEIESVDGDAIKSYQIEVVYDSDNDGSFNDETWETLTEGDGYTVTNSRYGYVAIEVSIKRQNVGKYQFRVTAEEEFGQDTLPIIPDTEIKGAEKTFDTEIDNVSPNGTFSTRTIAKGDVVFAIGDSTVSKQIQNATQSFANEFGDEASLSVMDVMVETVETSKVDMTKAFQWKQDVNGAIGSITLANGGQNVVMYGNPTNEGKNAIWIPSTENGVQKFTFNYSIDYGDNFNAAGMLFNLVEGPGYLDAYALSFNNSGAFSGSGGSIWRIRHDLNDNYDDSYSILTKIADVPFNQSGTLTVEVNKSTVTISGGGLSSPRTVQMDYLGTGFGFFSNHYSHNCDSIGHFSLQNITLELTKQKTLAEAISDVAWRDGAEKFVIYVDDKNRDEMDPNSDDKYAKLMSALMGENIHLITLGSKENKAQQEALLEQLSQESTFYINTPYATALDNSVEFIKSILLRAGKDTIYVLLNEKVAYNKEYLDYNGDPQWLWDSVEFTDEDWVKLYWKYLNANGEEASFDYNSTDVPAEYQEKFEAFKEKMKTFWADPSILAQKWKYYHDPNYFDNPLGYASFRSTEDEENWMAKEVETFDKTGLYLIDYRIKDNPVPDKTDNTPDNPFDEYRDWSKNYANDEVNIDGMITNPYAELYVHRRPLANFSFEAHKVNGIVNSITINNEAYDLDHEFNRADKGLNLYEWKWKFASDDGWRGEGLFTDPDTAEAWINSQLVNLDSKSNTNILLQYRVRDVDGYLEAEDVTETVKTGSGWTTQTNKYAMNQGAWSEYNTVWIANAPQAPVAHFKPNNTVYDVGEEITIEDNSYSPNGDKIVKWEFTVTRVVNGSEVKKVFTYTNDVDQMEIDFGKDLTAYIDSQQLSTKEDENKYKISLIVTDNKAIPLESDPYSVTITIQPSNNAPTIDIPDTDTPDDPGGEDGGGKTLWGKNNPTIYEYDPYDANQVNPYYTYGGQTQKRGSEYLDWTLVLDDPDNHDKYGTANDTTYYEVEFKTDRSTVPSREEFASVASSTTYPVKKVTAADALNNNKIAPFTTAQNEGLEWGAYRITTNVTDIPLNGTEGKTTTMVTSATEKPLHLYVIPKLDLTNLNYVFNGIVNNPEKISPGEEITVNATTNDRSTGARLIFRDGEGTNLTQEMTFVGDNGDGTYSWTATMTIPGNLEEEDLDPNETYKFTVQTYTTYGSMDGEETRQKEGTITLNILPLKLYDFHITSINDPSINHASFPMYVKDLAFDASDNIDPETGEGSLTKLGYAFNFTLYSKGLKNDTDSIRIRPTFWGYNMATGQYDLELDMYYRNDNGEYVLATTNPDQPAADGDIYQLYLKGNSGTLLGSLREIVLTKDVRTTEAGAQKWSARYGIPGSAVFVAKGQPLTEENIERDEYGHGVLVMFDIEALKNGSPKYNYIDKGQWHEERLDENTGAYLNPNKAWYEDGSVIVIDPNHNSLDNYESRPVWTK